MSKENLNKKSKKEDFPHILLKDSPKLIIPKNVIEQIRFCCDQLHSVEWSGVLFYDVKGTIEDPENMTFYVKDILFMDKGTKTSTDYEIGEEVVEYRMEDPKRLEWKMGHIHSHNTMDVYFSGVDMDELKESSVNYNYYLSLIVNNNMDMVAKAAFIGEYNGFTCLNEKGEEYTLTLKNQKKTLFSYDCDIKSSLVYDITEEFKKRFQKVVKECDKKAKRFSQMAKKTFGKSTPSPAKFEDPDVPPFFSTSNSLMGEEEEESDIRQFCTFIMCNGFVAEDYTLDMALEDIQQADLDPDIVASSIVDNYTAFYEGFWDEHSVTDIDSFIERTRLVEEELQTEIKVYPFLKNTVSLVGLMVDKVAKEV